MALHPVNRRSVPEDVFEQIVSGVLSGEMKPGETLPSERRLAEVLGAMLTGMRLSVEQSGVVLGDTRLGHFVMAIDPSTFVPAAVFAERHASYLDGFKTEPGIMPAGGPEWAKRVDREAKGIPLAEGLLQELAESADKAKVDFPL